jgi:recombination protein RecT
MAATTTASRPAQKPTTPAPVGVAELITQNIGVINRIMPKYLNAERMIQLAISYSRKPELRDCTPASFVGVFMAAAQLGLELDVRGEAYAVPFWNKKCNPPRKEAQFIAGYKGLIKLATNSGKVRNVFAHEVRQGDEFDYGYGLEPYLIHKPGAKRGDVTHVYAVGAFTNGGHHFEVMSIEEVYALRDKFSKAAKSGPWVDNPREMCLKTVCRRLCKFLPASTDLARAVALDEANEAQIPQDLGLNVLGMDGNTIDADYTAESPDQDAEDMEAVKANIRNGNGNGSAPAAKPTTEKSKETAKPAAKEPPAETPAEEETAAQTPELMDHQLADMDILYQDFRSRIIRAANQPEAVAVYTEAAQDSVLGSDYLAKLQSDLRTAVSKFKGGK